MVHELTQDFLRKVMNDEHQGKSYRSFRLLPTGEDEDAFEVWTGGC